MKKKLLALLKIRNVVNISKAKVRFTIPNFTTSSDGHQLSDLDVTLVSSKIAARNLSPVGRKLSPRIFVNIYSIALLSLVFISCKKEAKELEVEEPQPTAVTYNPAIEQAHKEIWGRFVNKYDIIQDFAGLDGSISLPTPEECKRGFINALGWWTPIENGSMFGGLYMDGAIQRWKHTKKEEDASKVRRLAKGLLQLASLNNINGFIGRGVCEDGISHYPIGSNDQTGGWIYGMWIYLKTDLPTAAERKAIETKMISLANALVQSNWALPAEPPYNFRGSFAAFNHNAFRMLFLIKVAFQLTKDPYWSDLYKKALAEKQSGTNLTRQDIAALGLSFVEPNRSSTWDESPSAGCLRELYEIEDDLQLKNIYLQGIERSAQHILKNVDLAFKFIPNNTDKYELNWRLLGTDWKQQNTSIEASDLALRQYTVLSTGVKRRLQEEMYVREPIFSAWIVSLSTNKDFLKINKSRLVKIVEHYNYANIYEVWFFPSESMWWRLQDL